MFFILELFILNIKNVKLLCICMLTVVILKYTSFMFKFIEYTSLSVSLLCSNLMYIKVCLENYEMWR